jgi:hypothetical protein
VTRAREAVGIAVARCIIATTNDESSEAVSATLVTSLDAYAAAVRAALLAEVVAVVAGVTLTPSLMNSRKTILTAIRALTEAR